MSERVERKIVTVEQNLWKQPEFNDFVMDVFDLFMEEFGPKERGYRNYLYHDFDSSLKDLNLKEEDNIFVEFPGGLIFAFCDFYPEQVYQNEFDDLINISGEKIQLPLEKELFFWVKVKRGRKDAKTFKRVLNFFQGLKERGYSIEEISADKTIKEPDYYGEVYVYLVPDELRGEVQQIPIKVLSPRIWFTERVRWAREK